MMYALAQDLISEPQQAVEGMCLADWQALDGFDVDDPDTAAQLIHPKIVAARTAGLLRSLAIERPGDSGNAGGFGQSVPSPCRLVVLHWWGNPVGQSHDGVVAWLRNPISQVSAHFVASPGRVTQILPLTTPSWANGNAWANANSVTIEADPNDPVGTMATVVDLLADLVRSGDLAPDFQLRGHRDYYSTACPGAYYQWLPTIRQRVGDALDDTTRLTANTQEEDDMPITQQDADLIAATILARQVTDLQPGGGKTTLGETIAEARAHHLDVLRTVGQAPDAILDAPVARGGRGAELGPATSLRAVVGYTDHYVISLLDGLGRINAAAADTDVTRDDLAQIVREAIADLAEGIEVPVSGTVQIGGHDQAGQETQR